MADTELEEVVGLMGMNWEDVDELFQKAMVTNLEDLYEIGVSDNFEHRQLLGSEDCKMYAEAILRIRGLSLTSATPYGLTWMPMRRQSKLGNGLTFDFDPPQRP